MVLENIYVVTDRQTVREIYEKYAAGKGVRPDRFELLSTMNEVTVRDAVSEAVGYRSENAQRLDLVALQMGFSPKPVLIDGKSTVESALDAYNGRGKE